MSLGIVATCVLGLEEILEASLTDPTAAAEIRRTLLADLGRDRLDVDARRDGDKIRFTFPTAILVGRKPG